MSDGAAAAEVEVFRADLAGAVLELGAARFVLETPEPVAASNTLLSFMFPIVLDVSDLESSRARGREGGILGAPQGRVNAHKAINEYVLHAQASKFPADSF